MGTTLKHLRTAVLVTAVLAVGGNLAAQTDTKGRVHKRSHRIFAAQTGPDQVTLAWDQVPGTTEYRIYLPDPNKPGPPAPGTRPWTTLSGSGERATVTGVRRLANGAYLEAVADGEVLYRGTFNAVTRAALSPVTAPGSVRAQETGETEVTVSWSAVTGATAYMIARAAGGSGWQMVCDVCPPSGEFVDTSALPGLPHAYSVAAIFPQGVSTRTTSNRLTVGAAQLAAATAASQATAAASWDKPMSTGTPVAGTDADNSNVGASGGTPTTSTPAGGTGTPTGGTGTPTTGGCPPGTVPITAMPKTGTPVTWVKEMSTGTPVPGTGADNSNVGASAGGSTGTTTGQCVPTGGTGSGGAGGSTGQPTTWTPGGTSGGTITPPGTSGTGGATGQPTTSTPGGTPAGNTGTPTTTPTTGNTAGSGLQPPAQVNATVTGMAAGSAWISWTPSPSSGVTGYVLYRTVNGSSFAAIRQFGTGALGYADTAFAYPLFAQGPVMASYYLVATGTGGTSSGPSSVTPQVQIQPKSTSGLPQIVNEIRDVLGGGLAASTGTHTASPATSTPSTATPTPPATLPSCKLDYQRADNMWAAQGRPDGNLGVESITLANGQAKVFVTDWKYEKQRNDGFNYYGSHLRLATNTGAGVVRLRLNNPATAIFGSGVALAERLIGSSIDGLLMKPGDSAQFRDDLMEVHCGQ